MHAFWGAHASSLWGTSGDYSSGMQWCAGTGCWVTGTPAGFQQVCTKIVWFSAAAAPLARASFSGFEARHRALGAAAGPFIAVLRGLLAVL